MGLRRSDPCNQKQDPFVLGKRHDDCDPRLTGVQRTMALDRDTLDRLYRYAVVLTNDGDSAFDLLHRALEKYLGAQTVEARDPVAYVRRIIRNTFFDDLRRSRVVPFEPLPEPDAEASPLPELEATVIDRITLDRIWARLQPPEREALYYWAVEGMSANEIGLHLGEPRGSILSRLKRARDRISGQQGETHWGGDP